MKHKGLIAILAVSSAISVFILINQIAKAKMLYRH